MFLPCEPSLKISIGTSTCFWILLTNCKGCRLIIDKLCVYIYALIAIYKFFHMSNV